MRRIIAVVTILLLHSSLYAQTPSGGATKGIEEVEQLGSFQVIELRRYIIKPGERENFAHYFESYFPEAFEQLGAIAVGQFFERKNEANFLWLRGFHDMDDRAKINSLFYYGPLWKEHKATLNSLMIDSDNVLLLKPVDPARPMRILPAVDPVREKEGAHGVGIVQIFPVKADDVEAFVAEARPAFQGYREAGAQEIGVLETLDANNNFPQLPIRTDGSYVVWIGIVRDDEELKNRFAALADQMARKLKQSGHLRGETETVVLDPTKRSRMRWLP
jgi:hypothetical protein